MIIGSCEFESHFGHLEKSQIFESQISGIFLFVFTAPFLTRFVPVLSGQAESAVHGNQHSSLTMFSVNRRDMPSACGISLGFLGISARLLHMPEACPYNPSARARIDCTLLS